MLACSGGASSLALVGMVKQGLHVENQHRRLRFVPLIVHVNESAVFWPNKEQVTESTVTSQQVLEYLSKYDLHLYGSRLEKVFAKDEEELIGNSSLPVEVPSQVDQLRRMLSSLKDESNKEELIKRLRIRLLMSIAIKLNCDMIFFASTATRLATQLIVDVAQGKGNQIHLETGFNDDRLTKPIMKPLRELTQKEVTYYNLFHKIAPFTIRDIHTKSHSKVSIGKATEEFMRSLERDFPATVFSVTKISTKVRNKRTNGGKCSLCGTMRDNEELEENSAIAARMRQWRDGQGRQSLGQLNLCYTCYCVVQDSKEDEVGDFVAKTCQENLQKEVRGFLIDE